MGGDVGTVVDARSIVDPALARLVGEIRRRRLAADLSQSQLALRAGYARQYISAVERPGKGGVPSPDLIKAIDDALDADGELIALRQRALAGKLSRRRNAVDRASRSTARDVVEGSSVSASGSGSIAAPVSERVHELFVRAQSLLSTNDRTRVEAAVSLLDRALEIEPQFARARAAHGYAAWRRYFSGGGPTVSTLDAALNDVGAALSRDPSSIGARTTQIRICWDMGWHERAIEIGRQVHQEWPESLDAVLAFARALHNGGLAELALPLTRQVLAVDPTHPTALKLLIWSLVMTGQHDAAIRAARPYLSSASRDSNTRWAVALAHWAAGDAAEAVRTVKEAVNADPHDVTVRALEGYLLRATGDHDGARAVWVSALRFVDAGSGDVRGGMNLRSRLWLACVEACVGQEESARSGVADAVRREPHNGYVGYRAAHVLAELGDHAGAIRALDEAVAAGFLSVQLLRHDERLGLRGLVDHPGYRDVVSMLLANVEHVRSRYIPNGTGPSAGG
ncbi:MAG: helix-turn-helix domain-containing protein [Pseudonocardia sp.]